jgi:hypothetical protein
MTVDGGRRRGAGFGGIHGCGGQLGLRLVRAGVEGIGRKGTLLFQLVIFFFVWWFGAGFVCIIVQPCFTFLTIVHLDKEIVRAGNKFYDIRS